MPYRAALETGASDTVGEKTAQGIPQGASHTAPIREQPAYAIAIGPKRTDPIKMSTTTKPRQLMASRSLLSIETPGLATKIRRVLSGSQPRWRPALPRLVRHRWSLPDALAVLVPYAGPRRYIGTDAEHRADFIVRVAEVEQRRAVRTKLQPNSTPLLVVCQAQARILAVLSAVLARSPPGTCTGSIFMSLARVVARDGGVPKTSVTAGRTQTCGPRAPGPQPNSRRCSERCLGQASTIVAV